MSPRLPAFPCSRWLFGVLFTLLLAAASRAQTASPPTPPPAPVPPPVSHQVLSLDQLGPQGSFLLRGLANTRVLEFTVPKDQLVTQARLDLVLTPSPSLLDKLSHLRVYLNDEMVGTVSLAGGRPGDPQRHSLPFDPRLIVSFNRIRLEFVGHYTMTCEDLGHSALWLDVGRGSRLELDQQPVPWADDLAYLPQPFVDAGSMQDQTVPFVFARAPDDTSLQAAATLASYFGSVSAWRPLSFPVLYDQVPKNHAVVLAENGHFPKFLKGHPPVDGPTVEMMDLPGDPYHKALLVLGRNGDDLLTASRAIAMGSPLMRGRKVRVDQAVLLADRRPYDAPGWTPTDRPVAFSELVDYPGQLEVSGMFPPPITLRLNLPPDLFVWRNAGVPVQLRYRYTPPRARDESRLSFSLNHQFVSSVPLLPEGADDGKQLTRLPLLGNDGSVSSKPLEIPAFKIGANNQMRFDFSFASSVGSVQNNQCQTLVPADVRGSIDRNSTVDFSGFQHYLRMPNLQAFARSGFPFSRMADLSDTLIVVPRTVSPDVAGTVLETVAHIAAQTRLPAFKVRLTRDWNRAEAQDADVLWFGDPPPAMRERPDGTLIVQGAHAFLRQARAAVAAPEGLDQGSLRSSSGRAAAMTQLAIESQSPLAAIVEWQSPTHPERSWVGLLASSPQDFQLLRDALRDSGKRDVMSGGVVVIRDSGVYGVVTGPSYTVGHLPWWQLAWYRVSDHPVLLAAASVAVILLAAWLLWMALGAVARRRLRRHD
ncbi:Cyclic di-GMP-binding protein OS=Castellaniella defragrans OX=75697 GN=HNR28_001346 PE=3 SV=1 [Castellaniella defragrans]